MAREPSLAEQQVNEKSHLKEQSSNICGTGPKVVNGLHTCVCTYACIYTLTYTHHTHMVIKKTHIHAHRHKHIRRVGGRYTHMRMGEKERGRENHLEHRRVVINRKKISSKF